MEIVLGSVIDWLHRVLKNRSILKWLLIAAIFSAGLWLAYVEWIVSNPMWNEI